MRQFWTNRPTGSIVYLHVGVKLRIVGILNVKQRLNEELTGGTKRAVMHMNMLLEKVFEEDGYTWMNYASVWTCDHEDALARMDTTSLVTILCTTH